MTIALIQNGAASDQDTWYGQDMLLSLASVDLYPQLILLGAAHAQLRQDGDAQSNGRSLQKRYGLLELYDCPKPWVVIDGNTEAAGDWIMEVEIIDQQTLAERLTDIQKVLRYG